MKAMEHSTIYKAAIYLVLTLPWKVLKAAWLQRAKNTEAIAMHLVVSSRRGCWLLGLFSKFSRRHVNIFYSAVAFRSQHGPAEKIE